MLDYVTNKKFHPDTILYFVEDDYLHLPGWLDVLLEGFSIPEADYVTLYDHKDKYFFPMYKELKSRLFATRSCHFRETPSTTQTFATRFKTLLRDLPIHQKYSEGRDISQDHEKFLELGRQGATLISSIPGWSTTRRTRICISLYQLGQPLNKGTCMIHAITKEKTLRAIFLSCCFQSSHRIYRSA